MTEIIDQTKTFRLIEERIAETTNPRHLLMLNRLLQHSKGEANLDLDLVMSTLSANPTSPTSTTGNGNLLVKQSTTANLGSRPDVFAETDRVHI